MTVSNLVNNPELKRHTLTKHIRENHIEIEDANLMRRFEENKDKNTKLYSKFKNEKVAEETPEKIIKVEVDPLIGLMPFQAREVAFALNLKDGQIKFHMQ